MSYIAKFSGVNPETMTTDFNAYIALTLDETLTIELRTKALLSYLNEISGLLQAANAILEDLKDIVIYETDLIFQGWINDGTLAAIINQIITPIINQINNQVTNNVSLIQQLITQNQLNANQIQQLFTTVTNQSQTLNSLLTTFQNIQSISDDTTNKYKTLTDTINTALNTITQIQNRLTTSENDFGSLQDQVNGYETRYNTLQQSTFRQDIQALQDRVTAAQNSMETALEQHTNNITQMTALYASLTSTLDNLVSFADTARQFQTSILAVINFINQNQSTINSNQTAITLLTNQINTLLDTHFDYTSQLRLIDQILNRPNFTFDQIQDVNGGLLSKTRMNGVITYNGIVASPNTTSSALFTDPELGVINNNLTQTQQMPTFLVYTLTPSTVMGIRCTISTTGVCTMEVGLGSQALMYVNFSIYIPLLEVS